MMEILFLLFKKKNSLICLLSCALLNVLLFEMVPEMRLKSTVFIFFIGFNCANVLFFHSCVVFFISNF